MATIKSLIVFLVVGLTVFGSCTAEDVEKNITSSAYAHYVNDNIDISSSRPNVQYFICQHMALYEFLSTIELSTEVMNTTMDTITELSLIWVSI